MDARWLLAVGIVTGGLLAPGCAVVHKVKSHRAQRQFTQAPTDAADGVRLPVIGLTKCAHCEYDLHPISDPESDGLAVVAEDGNLYVVEGAETSHADIFGARFDDVRVALDGTVVKSEGRIHWVRPTSLTRSP